MGSEGRSPGQYGTRVYQGILPPWWDTVDISYPDGVTEVYAYSITTDSGFVDIQAIINVVYTDVTKADILQVKKVFHKETAY